MPGGDRTGPLGSGPRTGRAAGYCAGYGVPGYANSGNWWRGGPGFGRGHGGRGSRRRYMFYETGLPGWARSRGYAHGMEPAGAGKAGSDRDQGYFEAQEIAVLKEQTEQIRRTLDNIEDRLAELGKMRQSPEEG